MTSAALQKRLLALFYDAHTIIEEQGTNILYLALGMLRWSEDGRKDTPRQAPLILVPVALERRSAADRFTLRWLQEDPSENLSLAAKLKAEFGILMPPFPEPEALDVDAYFAAVADAVKVKPDWGILANDIVLGFFSFAKHLMHRDLDPALWPADAPIDRHPLIQGLLRDGFDPPEPLFGEDAPLDAQIGPERMLHVVDCDSSQMAVVEEVRHSRNLVVQGPPGTGKSQTIANAIAAAVADGRKGECCRSIRSACETSLHFSFEEFVKVCVE